MCSAHCFAVCQSSVTFFAKSSLSDSHEGSLWYALATYSLAGKKARWTDQHGWATLVSTAERPDGFLLGECKTYPVSTSVHILYSSLLSVRKSYLLACGNLSTNLSKSAMIIEASLPSATSSFRQLSPSFLKYNQLWCPGPWSVHLSPFSTAMGRDVPISIPVVELASRIPSWTCPGAQTPLPGLNIARKPQHSAIPEINYDNYVIKLGMR